jgi:hypothetical protein
MTEKTNGTDGDLTAVQAVEEINSHDWFLQTTITNVISLGVEVGVTLTVRGVIVSGMLIDGKKYFEELAETVRAASGQPEDIADTLAESWKQYTSIYEEPEDAPEDWQPAPVGYIHLKNARFFAPGQDPFPAHQSFLWRGKLSSVDSFFLGNVSTDQSSI